MKKVLFLLIFLIPFAAFSQYTGNKLPSGLTVSTTVDSADYTIIQKNGETIVKAVRMDTLKTFFNDAILESIQSLDSVSGSTGQFIISDGSGWLAPASAKYEGDGAYTFGYRTGTVGWGSMVIGGGASGRNSAIYPLAMAIGYNSDATEEFAVAIGRNATASGLYSLACQYGTASGTRSFAVGSSSYASGDNSVSFIGGDASGDYSFAWNSANAGGTHSTAWNSGTSDGVYSTAWNNGIANANYSTAIGQGVYANSFYEISIGSYNDTAATSDRDSWVATDRLFTIGNGTSGSESNALTILKNGNTTIDGNLTADTVFAYVQSQNAFAEIYYADAATPQSIPNGTTYTKIVAFTTDGEENNCTADAANDKITITETGYYQISGYFSTICATNGTVGKTALFAGGTEVSKIHKQSQWTNTVTSHSGAIGGILKVETVPIDIDVRIRHDQAGAVNFTGVYGNLSCRKISDL